MNSYTRRQLDFRFSIPQPPAGPLLELSAAEVEKMLLKRLEDQRAEPTGALWQLARFYSHSRNHEKALDYLGEILARLPDLESRANCVLAMGQTMEHVQDYAAAVRYYREALAMAPARTPTWCA
jgi:tetratricopeptide (TPR) repeat protein